MTALSNLSPVFSDADHATLAKFKFTSSGTGLDQGVPADLTCKSGFWVSAASRDDDRIYACVSSDGRFVTFSQSDIENIRLDNVKPAKGGGGRWIMLSIRKHGVTRLINLANEAYENTELTAVANRLAQKLQRSLEILESYDC